MYVCLCRGLTDEDLKNFIKEGYSTPKALMEHTLAGLGCSICKNEIERIVMETNQCTTAPKQLLIDIIKPF